MAYKAATKSVGKRDSNAETKRISQDDNPEREKARVAGKSGGKKKSRVMRTGIFGKII